MLQPKRTKFRKAHKGRIHGLAKGGTSLNFGTYGLKAMEPERISARQIEATEKRRKRIGSGYTPRRSRAPSTKPEAHGWPSSSKR